jgi:hypothetical protein
MQIDLGAERLLAAERDAEKIAVEVISFINPSAISRISHRFWTIPQISSDTARALRCCDSGDLFESTLRERLRRTSVSAERTLPARILYLPIPYQTYEEFFRLRFIQEGVIEYQRYLVSLHFRI